MTVIPFRGSNRKAESQPTELDPKGVTRNMRNVATPSKNTRLSGWTDEHLFTEQLDERNQLRVFRCRKGSFTGIKLHLWWMPEGESEFSPTQRMLVMHQASWRKAFDRLRAEGVLA